MTIALGAILFLNACSSDNSNKENGSSGSTLVGNWHSESGEEEYDIQFLSNGTVVLITTEGEDSGERYRDSGTYRTNGNKVAIIWKKAESWNKYTESWITDDEDTETVVLKFKIQNNTLYISSQSGNESVVMTRI